MRIHFSELNYETLYPLTVKLDNGNIYDGRFTDLRVNRASIPTGLYAYDVRDCCDGEPMRDPKVLLVGQPHGDADYHCPIPEAEKGEGYVRRLLIQYKRKIKFIRRKEDLKP